MKGEAYSSKSYNQDRKYLGGIEEAIARTKKSKENKTGIFKDGKRKIKNKN
jgi:hypothetical protein